MSRTAFIALSTVLTMLSTIAFPQRFAFGETVNLEFDAVGHYRFEVLGNPGGLPAYKAETTQLLESLTSSLEADENVLATITFSKSLDVSEVEEIVDRYDLDVEVTHITLIQPYTRIGTHFSTMLVFDAITDEASQEAIEFSESSVVGVSELVANVPASQTLALNSDDRVYLVDPSADSRLVDNPNNDYMQGLFWELEGDSLLQILENFKANLP